MGRVTNDNKEVFGGWGEASSKLHHPQVTTIESVFIQTCLNRRLVLQYYA